MTARGRPPPPPAMIDLDQYMRAPVRRNTQSPYNTMRSNKLVVDHGRAVHCRPASSSSSDTPAPADRKPNHKRYSHDSGLSDGSFKRRKHRSNRRTAAASSDNDSLHAFRQVCERTLKQQQTQIERVAALCEQLAVRHSAARASTDLSSTTGTRTDCRDKHNVSQCKTYKIIIRKLEELNRVFSTSPRYPHGRVPPAARSSVTVVDKLVATDDLPAVRNMTPRLRTVSPYRASIVMESVVQTDFPVPSHTSTDFRPKEFRQFHRNQYSGKESVCGGVWRALRTYLTLCFPHLT